MGEKQSIHESVLSSFYNLAQSHSGRASREYYKIASEKGHADATYELALHYGKCEKYDKMIRYATRLMALGDEKSLEILYEYYRIHTKDNYWEINNLIQIAQQLGFKRHVGDLKELIPDKYSFTVCL